jgi:Rrf2 family protein
MRLSARADYALRAAIELAAAGDGHVTAEQLAQAQHIPGKFLETILTHLRRSGLVRSQRGPDGGFWLARAASDISLADIIRAIDGQLLGVRGERPENVTYPGAAEPLQRVWIALRANERAVLETVTLADIVSGKLPEAIQLLTDSPQAWILQFPNDRPGQTGTMSVTSPADGIWPSSPSTESAAPGTSTGTPGRRRPGSRGTPSAGSFCSSASAKLSETSRNTWDSGVSRAAQMAASSSEDASLRPRSTSER